LIIFITTAITPAATSAAIDTLLIFRQDIGWLSYSQGRQPRQATPIAERRQAGYADYAFTPMPIRQDFIFAAEG
jgi:hypothetical protein